MLKLRIEDDEGGETLVAIVRDEITIGREEGNTIRLPERNVSRQHARLVRRDGGLYLESVAARYGVRKNGQRVEGAALFGVQDTFLIGDYKLSLHDDRPRPSSQIEPAFQEETTQLTSAPERAEGTEVMTAEPARLVVISSNFAGQEFPLNRREMVIGRGDGCDIIIDHRSVSLRHVKIVSEGPRAYQVLDLNSKNGVFVNGESCPSSYVKRGDEIELGHVRFRFVEPGESYTFDPSAEPDYEAERPARKAPIWALVFLALAVFVLAGVAIVSLRPAPRSAGEPAPLAASPGAVRDEMRAGLEEARASMERGKIERAIGALEALERGAENSAERAALGELLAAARAERPFLDHYRRAFDALERDAPFDAIEELSAIPDHSVFAALADERGLDERAIKAASEAIERDARSGLVERGAEHLDELALFVPKDDERLKELRTLLGPAPSNKAQTKIAPKRPSQRKVKKERAASQPARAEPQQSGPTREEITAGVESAAQAYFNGDDAAALSICAELVRHGASAKRCHGTMAQAYKRQKRYDEACSSFKRALRYFPSSNMIRTQMDDIRCGE